MLTNNISLYTYSAFVCLGLVVKRMISYVDLALILLYFASVALVGYVSSRKESGEDFLIAKKNLGVFSNVSTISATKITASVIITYVALVYIYGVSAIWAYVGMVFGYLFFLFFALKIKKEGDKYNYYTLSDYFYRRYGERTGKIVSFVLLISIFMNFIIQLIGGSKIIQSLTGLSFSIGVVVVGLVILFYLYLGGFKAVVKTDLIQFVAIIVLFCALGFILVSNFSFEPSQWQLFSAGPGMIIPLLVVGMLFPFSAADLWQRSYAAKSVKTLKKSFIYSMILYLAFGVLLSFIAIIIKLKLPGINPDRALVEGFMVLLPSGFIGLGVVALFAAIMSSADSFAFITASVLVQDIVFRKKGSKYWAGVLKYAIFGVVGVGMLVARLFESIVEAAFLLTGIFMVLSVVVLATWIRRYISRIVLNCSLIIGLVFTFVFTLVKGITPVIIVAGVFGGLVGLLIGAIISSFVSTRRVIRL